MPPSNAANRGLIERGLAELGIQAEPVLLEKLIRYVCEIELWNQAYGLVNDSGDSLIIRHILDSLSGLSAIRALAPATLADAGSGAGLPGIPLSLFMGGTRVSLIERSGKRCRFLENQKALLRLDNVDVRESGIGQTKGPFDVIVFRAFRPLEKPIIDELIDLMGPDGVLAAYKGKRTKIDDELAGIESYGLEAEIRELRVPYLEGEERHLVLLKRTSPRLIGD
jgi:16S rRNA (guanine527-N7)-methyltransferase